MAERLGGSLKRIGPRDDGHDHAAGDERHNLFPGFPLHRGRPRDERESGHTSALPDEVGHIDAGFAPCGIADRNERSADRQRAETVTYKSAPKALDYNVHAP